MDLDVGVFMSFMLFQRKNGIVAGAGRRIAVFPGEVG